MQQQQKIPLVDLHAQYVSIKNEIDTSISRVIKQGAFINGPFVKEFEQKFAQACSRKFCIGLSSGTSALKLALQAIGISPGDEVIIPTHTFIATAEAVSEIGAVPVFADIEDTTMNIDPARVREAITKRTKAIVPVHLYGQSANMKEIQHIAQEHGIAIVEDTAQSHLATHYAKTLPYSGIGTFSFYPGKNLGAYGDAGAVVCDDAQTAERIARLANHGRAAGQKYLHNLIGFNHRMDGIQGAILSAKLKHLPEWTWLRQQKAKQYDAELRAIPQIHTPHAESANSHVYHLYVIRAQRRNELLTHLHAHGIEAGIHYPVPLHLQPAYASLGHAKGDFPVAESVADSILSLPLYPEITEEQIHFICATIRDFYEK